MSSRTRIFTLEEANRLLPELDSRLTLLAHKKEAYARGHDALFLAELLHEAEREGGFSESTESIDGDFRAMETALADFERDLELMSELGCIIRDIERGWVEFLGRRDGKLVYFCWKRGESRIAYYRPLQDEAMARMPLESV